jgi:hypothetical protein
MQEVVSFLHWPPPAPATIYLYLLLSPSLAIIPFHSTQDLRSKPTARGFFVVLLLNIKRNRERERG